MTDTLASRPLTADRPLSGQRGSARRVVGPRRSAGSRRALGSRRGLASRRAVGSGRGIGPQPGVGPRRGVGRLRRLGGAIAYDVLLVPAGIQTMADALLDEPELASGRWRRLRRLLHPTDASAPAQTPPVSRVFGYGLLSAVLGLTSWFLLLLLAMAVVRGPFYGFVEHGPYGPGTWGGPTRAGAWAAHAGIALPSILLFLAALQGIAWLQAALVRRLDGRSTARWVLPATIAVAAGGLAFVWSWLQQL